MLTLLFLVLFFGLLAAGMPIFLVLGMCAGILYIATGQPLIGAAQMVINKLNSTTLMALPLFVMAAAFMRSGGVAKAASEARSASSPWSPARCSRRSAAPASPPRWRWGRSWFRR